MQDINIEFQWPSFRIHLGFLNSHIKTIDPNFLGVSAYPDRLSLGFSQQPNESIVNQINEHLSSLTEQGELTKFQDEARLRLFNEIVIKARMFGNELINKFAAENIALGITQAGKTKAVSDYLTDVIKYAQTGSLYEVLNEVTRLQQNGLPEDLSPFVTTQRLDLFKNKIKTYLGIPL